MSKSSSIASLRTENERLKTQLKERDEALESQRKQLETQAAELRAREDELARLQERLQLLLSKRYHAQSETLKRIQGSLFDECELEKDIEDTRRALDDIERQGAARPLKNATPTPRGGRPKRKPLPEHLRRVEVIVDVSDEDKQLMGEDWVCIGEECSEQLAVQQREYYVKHFKRKKYVRRGAPSTAREHAQGALDDGIKVAPAPKVMLSKAIADGSLLADVLSSKFVDAMSFYRTNKRLAREGIDIGYSTLCDWPIQLNERLESWKRLWYEALGTSPLWHLDETTLQVLKEPGRDDTKISYLWALRSANTDPPGPLVLFHYHERRHYSALEQWLRPALSVFEGAIITDEHGPYNTLRRTHPNIKAHGGCWSHCRRKFVDAVKGRRDRSEAHKVLVRIAELYKREDALKALSGEAKRRARIKRVKPILDALHAYLTSIDGQFLHGGYMNGAIRYALNHWDKLSAFIEHPELPLDNNLMERAIRPFTIGRKNWIFAGSPRGAEASAFIYSMVESAKANGLEPKAYLSALFERYPLARNDDERRALLPCYFRFS